jgi:iron complex outermembrane recepter protein
MIRNVLKPLGSVRVAFAVAVGIPLFVFSTAFAQEPGASPAAQTGSQAPPTAAGGSTGAQAEVERVVVTGSNIPTAEEVGPNPVDTYRRDDITRLGVRTASDLITKLPSVAGAGVTESNTNGGDGSARIDLRGIDPKETLNLIDGRRVANVGFASNSPDFNMIPLGLIEHIDILKDGASPNYGADAVSGVVNVFLFKRFRGMEIYGSYGNTNMGRANDMAEETAYILAGTGDDKTDIVVYAGMYNRAAIFSRDIDVAHDADHAPFGGNDVRSGNYAGRVQGRALLPGIKDPTPHAYANVQTDPQYTARFLGFHPNPILGREHVLFNFADLTPNIAPTDREYFYGSLTRDICDKYLTAFADFKYVRQFWDGGLAPAPFVPDVWVDTAHPLGISGQAGFSVPTQNAFSPFTVANYTSGPANTANPSSAPIGTGFVTGVRYRGVEAGLRTDKILTDNYYFTAGLRGEMGEFGDYFKTWNWETGFRFNEDHRLERFGGIVNNNALRAALLDTNPNTAFNPFGLNLNGNRVLQRVFVTTNHFGAQTEMLQDAKLTGDLFNLPAGPVSFAIGGEHRGEKTSDQPDALTSSGQTTGATNFAPTRGSRDVWSAWWEVRVPVTSPSWNFPGLYSLELSYSERYENFSDFGDTERPKFTVRVQPIEAITLRAAYIEAFHAPTLGELFSGTAQSFPNVTDPTGAPTEPQVEQHLLGNPTLQPETAYEWTYGGVITFDKLWSPLQGLTLSADVVHIDLRGYTTTLDPQFVIDNSGPGGVFPTIFGTGGDPNTSFVSRDPATGAILLVNTPEQNLGQLICDDLDYEGVYTLQTSRFGHGDMGTLTATFNGTYIFDRQLRPTPISDIREVSGKFGGGFQGPNGGGSFTHNRWYSSLFYDGAPGTWLGGLDIGATVHFVGQYWDTKGFGPGNIALGNVPLANEHPLHNRKVREWITLDLIMNYTFNFPAPEAANAVAGQSKDGGKNVKMDGKDKNVMPVSTAEYNPCGWRAWLNNTTVTLGMNNVTDEEPPFVAAAFENGFDEQTANPKGRFWYVALKKRF